MSHLEQQDRDRRDLSCVARGDRAAFERLVARYYHALLDFAGLWLPTEAEAEDVVQEALISAFRNAESFRAEGTVKAWLLTITRRCAARHRRKKVDEPSVFEAIEDHASLPELGLAAGWGGAVNPERRVAASEHLDGVRCALETLAPKDRAVILLRDIQGLTGPETAAALDVPLSAVKSRLHRARLRLMAALRQGGYDGT